MTFKITKFITVLAFMPFVLSAVLPSDNINPTQTLPTQTSTLDASTTTETSSTTVTALPSPIISTTERYILSVPINTGDGTISADALKSQVASAEASLASSIGVTPVFTLANSLIVDLTPDHVDQIKAANMGLNIEKDVPFNATATTTFINPPSWGLDRIDQRDLPLDHKFTYQSESGSGVNVYVIDTGVLVTHVEFGGRAVFAANFIDGINTDCAGHGTHVAGSIGGATVGVAKNVNIFGVKVLDCSGSGTTTSVMNGIQFVINQHTASSNKKTIINMSLGGGKVQALNDLVDLATADGILSVVAAGNNNGDACLLSPASAPSAITVAASGLSSDFNSDVRATFSNFGTCVDLYAPGVEILSALIGDEGDGAYNPNMSYGTLSGTSMSSPHVAGVASLFDSVSGPALSPAALTTHILTAATPNKITGNPAGTPNLLLFDDATSSGPNCLQQFPTQDGTGTYCVVSAASRDGTSSECTSQGLVLANIASPAQDAYIQSHVVPTSWIRSWAGNDFSGACLLLYVGGSISLGDCNAPFTGLCQTP